MSLNNGLGGVVTPAQTIGLGYAEELAATYHSNNCDVWIVFHERTNANYAAYLLTDTGLVTQPVISTVGPSYLPVDNTYCRSMLKFNREGTMAAQTARSATGPQVHNFDRSNGVFSAFLAMPAKPQFYDPYAACFAPNDSLLYVEVRYYSTNNTWSYILQYDLTYATGQQAADSAVVGNSTGDPRIWANAVSTDEKIYFAQYSHSTLGAINSPNTKGMGCNPTFGAVTLTGGLSLYGMPNFPSQFIGAGPSVGCTAPVAIAESVSKGLSVYPNPSQGTVNFDFADFEGMDCRLRLTDLMGRTTRTFAHVSLPFRLERADLPVGMYIYQLTSGNAVIGKGKLKLE
ncbi:MAG: T9SS type A sorting domain-containing protein [Bacteroidetes bacterium]|nr:T9SS type A sorting domain-containing protein [Bacteroidota bacterium]